MYQRRSPAVGTNAAIAMKKGFGTLSRQLRNDEGYRSSRVGVTGLFLASRLRTAFWQGPGDARPRLPAPASYWITSLAVANSNGTAGRRSPHFSRNQVSSITRPTPVIANQITSIVRPLARIVPGSVMASPAETRSR